MPSPFPGMDPYLESPTHWSDFHATFVPALRDAINMRLPKNYLARLDEHVSVVAPVSVIPFGESFIPDVTVLHRDDQTGVFHGGGSGAATAMLVTPEPVALENIEFVDERIESYVKIV